MLFFTFFIDTDFLRCLAAPASLAAIYFRLPLFSAFFDYAAICHYAAARRLQRYYAFLRRYAAAAITIFTPPLLRHC